MNLDWLKQVPTILRLTLRASLRRQRDSIKVSPILLLRGAIETLMGVSKDVALNMRLY